MVNNIYGDIPPQPAQGYPPCSYFAHIIRIEIKNANTPRNHLCGILLFMMITRSKETFEHHYMGLSSPLRACTGNHPPNTIYTFQRYSCPS